MPRSARLEYPDATYHVTSRGVQQSAIFVDDGDRMALLAIFARALLAHESHAYAYCLMGNHYHFVLQTSRPNLSALMHRVNTSYSLTFNRRHARRGHLFEGRFKALHVDRDAYLLEVCRYVDLNPVRARLVGSPTQWVSSSYRAHVGLARVPSWLATSGVHGALMGQVPRDAEQAAAAGRRYAEWVDEGLEAPLWKTSLREGLYLGDEAFVERTKLRRS